MRKAILFSAVLCLCFSALSLADSITSGTYTIAEAIGVGGTISGQDFSFTEPGTIDTTFFVPDAPPGTQFDFSNLANDQDPIGFYMNASYNPICVSGDPSQTSSGTYDGITATCLTGMLNYSAVLTAAPDGPSSATGPFTASGSVQGWVIAPGGDKEGPFTEVFDVPLTGQGTLELSDGPFPYTPDGLYSAANFTFTTPESSTALMMAIGLAMALGLAMNRRRREPV